MASLQSYPGKGKDAGKTFHRIQPYIDGKRVTFRLGSGTKKAEKASKAITDLIECRCAGEGIDLNTSTKEWLQKHAPESLCKTLISQGLIEELPERLTGEADSRIVTIVQ